MISKERKTNFNMTYAELAVLGHQTCDTVMRDITEFEKFGINSSKVTAFQSQVEELDNTPKDEELQGVVMDITIAKNELAEQVKTLIRKASVLVRLTYETNTGIYNALDIRKLRNKTNDELYRTAFGIVRVLRLKSDMFLPELQDFANELEVVNNQFLQKLKEKHFAIQDRDIATHERIELANSIYSQLSKFNNIGQAIWAEENEAKYNDYVIYGSSYKKPENAPPENSDSGDQDNDDLPNG